LLQSRMGVLGFGNMGKALVLGLLQKGTFPKNHIKVYDPDTTKQQEAQALGLQIAHTYADLLDESDVVLVACKPQNITEVLEGIRPALNHDCLIISIAAGISTEFIRKHLGENVRVIRVMPNTPALVLSGAAGIALGQGCGEAEEQIAKEIFNAVGVCEVVPEEQMDVVTALSGSGPAYFFYMVECMTKAAVAHGLKEAQATRLAAQTLLGAGLLLDRSGESAEQLRARVTSKGGTTEAALKCFMESGFDQLVAKAIEAAAKRSKELGK